MEKVHLPSFFLRIKPLQSRCSLLFSKSWQRKAGPLFLVRLELVSKYVSMIWKYLISEIAPAPFWIFCLELKCLFGHDIAWSIISILCKKLSAFPYATASHTVGVHTRRGAGQVQDVAWSERIRHFDERVRRVRLIQQLDLYKANRKRYEVLVLFMCIRVHKDTKTAQRHRDLVLKYLSPQSIFVWHSSTQCILSCHACPCALLHQSMGC
jgi:hypothetical protein